MKDQTPESIHRFLHRITILIFAVAGIMLLMWGFDYYTRELGIKKYCGLIAIGVAVALFILAILVWVYRKWKFKNLTLSLSVFFFIFITSEVIAYAYQCFLQRNDVKLFSAFSYPATCYDSVMGFKWQNGRHYSLLSNHGEVIYFSSFVANNYGLNSRKDFYPLKKDKKKKRIIVFGDSFTGGEFLETTWPDKTEQLLRRGNNNIEFYPFALSAIGVMNWYSIFFNKVVKDFEFDGVLFAIFDDDLNRGFSIINSSEKSAGFTRFDTIPESEKTIEKKILDIPHGIEVLTEKEIKNLKDNISKKEYPQKYRNGILARPGLYFTENLLKVFSGLSKPKLFGAIYKNDESGFSKRYGKLNFKMVDEMIKWCKKNNKEVYLCSIPKRQENDGKNMLPFTALSVKQLADFYEVKFINGYQPFNGYSKTEIENLYLYYDGHWNQRGSDVYATYMAKIFEVH